MINNGAGWNRRWDTFTRLGRPPQIGGQGELAQDRSPDVGSISECVGDVPEVARWPMGNCLCQMGVASKLQGCSDKIKNALGQQGSLPRLSRGRGLLLPVDAVMNRATRNQRPTCHHRLHGTHGKSRKGNWMERSVKHFQEADSQHGRPWIRSSSRPERDVGLIALAPGGSSRAWTQSRAMKICPS